MLFEAGMALGLHRDRTIIVELGTLRGLSDLAGRHVARINNTPQKRNELANRLKNAGCAVETDGPDWYEAGDFTAPKVPSGLPTGRRLPSISSSERRLHGLTADISIGRRARISCSSLTSADKTY